MKKFEVGKKYKNYTGKECECTKKTDKSVWFDGVRYELKGYNGNEYTVTTIRVKDFEA